MLSFITEPEDVHLRYHAILVDADGRAISMHWIRATEDEEAVRQAQALVDGHGVDLWDGVRFIEYFPALDPPK